MIVIVAVALADGALRGPAAGPVLAVVAKGVCPPDEVARPPLEALGWFVSLISDAALFDLKHTIPYLTGLFNTTALVLRVFSFGC